MPAAPIGLYFAHLWYYEELYPLIFTTGAFGKYLDTLDLDLRSTDERSNAKTPVD